ncbi:hypothetical protein PN498_22670 [Oscillatoria sp. CS-180]|nr:hypothetical protein [Oscillatoria sp. CS-180]
MKLLPRDRFSIQTHQSLSEIVAILEPHIEAPRIRWGFSRNHPPYTGSLSESGFEIRRLIHYRNSFLPKIHGRFEAGAGGTTVHITMTLHPLVLVFLVAWGSFWYTAAIPLTLSAALTGEVHPAVALLFLVSPLAALTLFCAAFWYEAKRSRRELTQMLQGVPLSPSTSSLLGQRTLKLIAWAIGTITLVILVQQHFITPEISPPPQTASYCKQSSTPSPYCDFAQIQTFTDHPAATQIALSPDGQTLVSGGSDKAIKVWDLSTGTVTQTLQSDSGRVTALEIAPDNHTIISGAGDRMVRIWDPKTPNQSPQMLQGHTTHDLNLVRVTADDTTIISGGYGEINLWNRKTGELDSTLPEKGQTEFQLGPVTIQNSPPYFRLLDISATGKKLLIETHGRVQIWDLDTNQQTELPRQWFTSLTSAHFSPDTQTVVTTSYTQPNVHLKIWNSVTGELQAKILLSSDRESWGYGDRLALNNNVVMVSTGEGLKIWDLQTTELIAVLEQDAMHRLTMSADGHQLIGLTGDGFTKTAQIQIWQRPYQ